MNDVRDLTLRAVVLAVLAGGLVRLAATDAYLAYVKPGMRIPLLLSVAALVVLALASANAADRRREGGGHDVQDAHEGHAHGALPRIGWWLVVPVICIALVPLNPLGADAVGDRAANEVSNRTVEPTAASGEVTMLDFVSQVINDPANPFDEPVTLVGFVTEDPEITDGFVLARFVMSCCAADAQPLLVHVVTDEIAGVEAPPRDSWVRVTGDHEPAPAGTPDAERLDTRNIVLVATEIETIAQPSEPYETY